jgi:hypothetical protein
MPKGTRLLGWARTGVPSYEYERLEARAAAIQGGATRPAAVLIEDVWRTATAFADAAADMPRSGTSGSLSACPRRGARNTGRNLNRFADAPGVKTLHSHLGEHTA